MVRDGTESVGAVMAHNAMTKEERMSLLCDVLVFEAKRGNVCVYQIEEYIVAENNVPPPDTDIVPGTIRAHWDDVDTAWRKIARVAQAAGIVVEDVEDNALQFNCIRFKLSAASETFKRACEISSP